MACKYTYKGMTYNSKEEFINQVINPQFLSNKKVRRVMEVQSDLFQKGRDKNSLVEQGTKDKSSTAFESAQKDSFELNGTYYTYRFVEGTMHQFRTTGYEGEMKYQKREKDSPKFIDITKEEYQEALSKLNPVKNRENQFLQLLNKDNNWVTFFVKSIIQDSAKKGYEKVLFPTGNTASKVEGHTTLEEFKKQKEDRIKELEKQNNNDNSTIGMNNYFSIGTVMYKKKNNVYYANSEIITKDNYENNLLIAKENDKEKNNREINQLKQELERVETEGFGALKPIYNFYENTVTNILKKQGYSAKLITDEYGNTWNEISLNQARDLANILLQRNEANQIIGQANIKAMTVLIDAVNQRSDTIPHEYAHHYIAWFRNAPIVQEAIKKWGSEEALVQSIGEQVVKQKGEAYNWWNKFVKWIMNQFNSLSKLQKEELTQILTDAFLTRQDLGSKADIQGFKDFINNNQNTNEDTSKIFYQLAPDSTRKELNQELTRFVKDILNKMGISTRTFEEYLKDFNRKNPDQQMDMVAFSDMFNRIIAYNEKTQDGTTLSEEMWHFIIDMMWDSPEVKEIRELKDEDGNLVFKKSGIWERESLDYYKIYSQTISNKKELDEKVEKEIIAKLLAQNLYDNPMRRRFLREI
jgi:hypothetical protein